VEEPVAVVAAREPDAARAHAAAERPMAPAPARAKRKLPMVPLLGGAAVIGIVATFFAIRGGKGSASAAPDSSAATPTPALTPVARPVDTVVAPRTPATGFISMLGDLPRDVSFWLDGVQLRTRVFPAAPGEHDIEVETLEFKPWATQVTVTLGDTAKVEVELELKDSTVTP